MTDKYKELKRNTIIIAISNFGSKIIAFVLAPLYSYYMTVSEYGTMDIVTSTLNLIAPFIVLNIFEATFRYSGDMSHDRDKVFSTSIAFCIPAVIICAILIVLSRLLGVFPSFFPYICICAAADSITNVLKQYLRGAGKMVQFAATGIIASVVLLATNYIFLVHLRLGLDGWVYSYTISRIVTLIYLLFSTRFLGRFSFAKIDKCYIKEFLIFCLPLMPTAIMWWVMNLSDRYMLAFFIGTASTGIYAVSNKLPNLLSIFENIFYQAWQVTAINSLNDDDRDDLYSRVFNNYCIVMLIGVLGVLLVAKPMVIYLFEESYAEAYIYIPILVICVVIHALNGNLGSLYSVFKSTKGALYSTIAGAGTNIILNLIFIPLIGIWGACITTFLGYIVTLIYRWFDTKKFVKIKLSYKNISLLVIAVVASFSLYFIDGIASYLIRVIIILVVIISNRKLVLSLIKR